jgi:hypothetical protein
MEKRTIKILRQISLSSEKTSELRTSRIHRNEGIEQSLNRNIYVQDTQRHSPKKRKKGHEIKEK